MMNDIPPIAVQIGGLHGMSMMQFGISAIMECPVTSVSITTWDQINLRKIFSKLVDQLDHG